ncbi:MAG: hypothetical protein HQ530_03725 [Parcubacteria group bacterium]|nr:hypothetical protein [Parcubacteria group bacterium]
MNKKSTSKQKFSIIHSGSAGMEFANYHFGENFKNVRDDLRERRYTTSNVKVTYRMLGNWDKNGLLPEGIQGDRGWRKFNYFERVWMQIVIKLRDFGLSLDKIASVRENVMFWNNREQIYQYFECYVVKALFSSDDAYVVVLSDGTADIAFANEIEASKIIFGHRSLLLISFKSILEEMGSNVKKARTLHDLTDEEAELISEIRMSDSNKIKVKMHEEGLYRGRRIKQIDTKITTDEIPKNYEAHKSAKEQELYGKVIINYEGGKPVSYTVKKRKHFKK